MQQVMIVVVEVDVVNIYKLLIYIIRRQLSRSLSKADELSFFVDKTTICSSAM